MRIYNPTGEYLRDISLIDFRDLFTSSERDSIIDGKKRIYYYPEYGGFEVSKEPNQLMVADNFITPIFLTKDDIDKLNHSEIEYESLLENSHATDSILITGENSEYTVKPQVEVYFVETAEDREKAAKEHPDNTPKTHILPVDLDEDAR